MDKYFKFIEDFKPSFRRVDNNKLEMFTVPTQHIEGTSAKELLDIGIEIAEKTNGKSPLFYMIEKLNSKGGLDETR